MRNPVKIHVAITAAESSFKVTTANSTVSASVSALDTAPEGQAVSSSLTNCLVMIYPPDENLSLLVAFLKQHKEDEKIMICFLTRSFVELYVLILKQLNQEKCRGKIPKWGIVGYQQQILDPLNQGKHSALHGLGSLCTRRSEY